MKSSGDDIGLLASLCMGLLQLDPAKRLTAEGALRHPFFAAQLPVPPPLREHQLQVTLGGETQEELPASPLSPDFMDAKVVVPAAPGTKGVPEDRGGVLTPRSGQKRKVGGEEEVDHGPGG